MNLFSMHAARGRAKGRIKAPTGWALSMVLLLWGIAGFIEPAMAEEKPADEVKPVCTTCHVDTVEGPILSMRKTRHGVKADQRTPTCTSCHGASEEHMASIVAGQQDKVKPDRTFTKNSTTPVDVRNQTCLTCHQGGKRIHWSMSAHSANDVACATCHKVHTAQDKVRDKRTQTEVCFTCHKEQRAQVSRPSRHPILEGKVACSDCHNPHGTAGEKLLVRDNVNDTCYACHMEKRGPFVRTHQPVQENCAICHNPHGSTLPNLLRVRPPYLCQECHEPTSHRGNFGSLTGTSTSANLAARGCLNCHTNIHGTNNPADISNERTFRR